MAPVVAATPLTMSTDTTDQLLAMLKYFVEALSISGASWWVAGIAALLSGIGYLFIKIWVQKKLDQAAWEESQKIKNEAITQNPVVNQVITNDEQKAADKTDAVLTPPVVHKKPRPPEPKPAPEVDNSL